MIRRQFRHHAPFWFGMACALFFGLAVPAEAQTTKPAPDSNRELAPVTIVIFNAPSLGAMLPNVIKQQKFDRANGLDITFEERPPDAYTAQFNSGEFKVGGSAALLTVGLADLRGIKVSYLFNLFNYWGAVVTHRPNIRSVLDLRGKEIAAAKGTTNYQMFVWFARQKGLDTGSLRVVNTATPGLVGYALADRADAVELWEPAYSLLLAKQPSIHTLDLDISNQWRKFAGSDHIPYLGVAAHQSWIESHRDLVPRLYKAYDAAARWVAANPAAAAPLIAKSKGEADRKAIEELVRDNTRLGMDVAPASRLKSEIEAVYRAGLSLGFLGKMPAASTIYDGKMD